MSTRVLIDHGHQTEWYDAYDKVVPRDGEVREALAAVRWRLPQKVWVVSREDAEALVAAFDADEADDMLEMMPVSEYSIRLWGSTDVWEESEATELWQLKRDVAHHKFPGES